MDSSTSHVLMISISQSFYNVVLNFCRILDFFLLWIRLGEFSNAKKDGTSLATKVIQLLLKLLYEDSSAFVLVGIEQHSHTVIY